VSKYEAFLPEGYEVSSEYFSGDAEPEPYIKLRLRRIPPPTVTLREVVESGIRTLGTSLHGLTQWEADRWVEKARAALAASDAPAGAQPTCYCGNGGRHFRGQYRECVHWDGSPSPGAGTEQACTCHVCNNCDALHTDPRCPQHAADRFGEDAR